jgi:hypothetical protein
MVLLSLKSCSRVAGGVYAKALQLDTAAMKEWLATSGMSSSLQTFFLDEFGPESIRRQLAIEASPTAAQLTDDFVFHYTDASAAVVLRGLQAGPIICIGQADEDEVEEVVFDPPGAYYAYQVD